MKRVAQGNARGGASVLLDEWLMELLLVVGALAAVAYGFTALGGAL